MRKSLLFFAIAASAVLVADAASAANKIRPLQNKYSRAALQSACSAGGGTFSSAADGGGYGCYRQNCDGKGGLCSIGCDNRGNCYGSTPAILVPKSTGGAKGNLNTIPTVPVKGLVRSNAVINPAKVTTGAASNSSLRFSSGRR